MLLRKHPFSFLRHPFVYRPGSPQSRPYGGFCLSSRVPAGPTGPPGECPGHRGQDVCPSRGPRRQGVPRSGDARLPEAHGAGRPGGAASGAVPGLSGGR